MGNKENCARYYFKNKSRFKQKALEKFLFVQEKKISIGKCIHCDEKNLNCLEWHHLGEKKFTIGIAYGGRKIEEIAKEIEKCILLCRNCHILMHYKGKKQNKVKVFINQLKSLYGCYKCGIKDFRVLCFHHKRDKLFNVSQRCYKSNLDSLFREIEKCEVLCANCHKKIHA